MKILSLTCALCLVGSFLSVVPLEGADIAENGPAVTGKLKGPRRDAKPVVMPGGTGAAKSMAKSRVKDGFKLGLWAAEPLLANPVAFCFDGKGRLYTSETNRYRTSTLDIRHYMFMLEDDLACRNQDDWVASIKKNFPKDWQQLGIETEVIRVLEDTDGDGKADRSSVFADGFNTLLDGIASGIISRDNSIWFTNIPSLWRFDGMNPDGGAASRTEMFRGFGVRFSYTGHDFHGLAFGPDGRLYFSLGDRGASVKTKEGGSIEIPDEGGVFRCEPDGENLELVMRGLRNPQELAFDDHGNLFTGDNDSDQGDRERWVVVMEGADAGWRIGWQHHPVGKEWNAWLSEEMWKPREAATPLYVTSPIANLPDGPSGLTYYPGTGFPEGYAGSFFLAAFKGSTAKSSVITFKSAEEGSGYRFSGLDTFVESCQATDVAFGPDSNLYVSAWDEGWDRTGEGRILRVSHASARTAQAARIAEVSKLLGEGFKERSAEELAALLGHWDQRVRLEAQWALAGRPEAPKCFSDAIARGKGLVRLHGIWGLGHHARLKKSPALVEGLLPYLKDGDAEVRAQVARALGDGGIESAGDALAAALVDPAMRVRFFAAQSLGKLRAAKLPELFEAAKAIGASEPYLRHAIMYAVTRIGNRSAIVKAASSPDTSVRRVALLAMHRLRMPEVARFLSDSDPSLVQEAARVISEAPIPQAYPALAGFLGKNGNKQMFEFRALNAAYRLGTPAAAEAVGRYAGEQNAPEDLRMLALTMLGNWGEPFRRDYVTGLFSPLPRRDSKPALAVLEKTIPSLLGGKNVAVAVEAAAVAGRSGTSGLAGTLKQLLTTETAAPQVKVAAIEALAALKDPGLDAAIDTAVGDRDASVRVEAFAILGRIDATRAAKRMAEAFPNSALPVKKTIITALGDLKSPAAAEVIEGWVKSGATFPAELQLELLEAAQKRPERTVRAAVNAWKAGAEKSDPLAPYAVALAGGNAAQGEKLFKEHAIAACLRCHKVGGQGGEAGPALDGIASRKDRRYLLESIVFPNATIADGFQTVVLTMGDGSVQAGLLKQETTDTVILQNPGSPTVTVKKSDIAKRETAPSGMIPGLGELLTRRELRDIMEYVANLK